MFVFVSSLTPRSVVALATSALFLSLPLACSGGDDGKTSSPSSSGPSSSSTSSSQTCHTPYLCVGGACKCTGGPKKDQSCCDPESGSCSGDGCDSVCQYCE